MATRLMLLAVLLLLASPANATSIALTSGALGADPDDTTLRAAGGGIAVQAVTLFDPSLGQQLANGHTCFTFGFPITIGSTTYTVSCCDDHGAPFGPVIQLSFTLDPMTLLLGNPVLDPSLIGRSESAHFTMTGRFTYFGVEPIDFVAEGTVTATWLADPFRIFRPIATFAFQPPAATVPEPAVLLLLTVALAMTFGLRHRWSSSSAATARRRRRPGRPDPGSCGDEQGSPGAQSGLPDTRLPGADTGTRTRA